MSLWAISDLTQAVDTATEDPRIPALEARLEGLTRRVQALETLLKEAPPGGAPIALPKGEPLWQFDEYTRGAPFRVLHQSLDRGNGRVDLLIEVAAEVQDKVNWGDLSLGAPVPLQVLPVDAGGLRGKPVPFTLTRGTSLAVGMRLHLSASLDPTAAPKVRELVIQHLLVGLNP
jgi:hypothetical protein